MKKLILIAIIAICTNVFAQKVDLINAPANPIVLKYKIEHFNLKGDVYCYDSKYYFDKEGFLVSKSDYQGDATYTYKNGKLNWDCCLNEQGYITKRNNNVYIYNDKGLLILDVESIPASYNKPLKTNTVKYSYDTLNRVIKQEESENDILKSTTTFKYTKEGTLLKVFSTETENSKTVLQEKRYKDGRLIYSKSNSDNIELKIESKLDDKGNSVYDDYINNGASTDNFSYTIVYYSDANKPQNYTVYFKKAYDGSIIPQTHKNGSYFYTKFKTQVEATKDMLFYDDLTKNYYLAKNAYDKTLPEGTTIKFELLSKNNEVLLKNKDANKVDIYFKGKNTIPESKSMKGTYASSHLFCFITDKNTNESRTFFFRNAEGKTFCEGEVLPTSKDHLYYFFDTKANRDCIIFKGENIQLTSFSDFFRIEGGGGVAYVQDIPTYTFPEYDNMEKDKIYIGRLYDAKTDNKDSNITTKETTPIKTTTAPIESCTSGNCHQGFGTLKKEYAIITGFFTVGKANGYGKEVFTDGSGFYTGDFVNGLRNGFGMYTWNKDLSYYIGEWKDGKQHGYGYFKKGSEVFQAGYYEKGKQTRNMLTQNYINKQAVGNCVGDCNNGFGYYQYTNGGKYVGFFTNGQLDHVGAFTWASGDAYIGKITNKQFTGQGTQFYETGGGTVYYGNFVNGIRQGLGVYLNNSNLIEQKGYWENGHLKTSY